ncbi:MAG: fatty-acid--CoA ligase [Epsilonproteobacteria bacterium]|nr:fatty-acid--CoA ligase [Campylobacterota bacterium]
MGFKKYMAAGLLLILIIGLYVFSFEGGKYTLDFFGIPITLPIAVWIIVPAFILYLFTLLHMMFYGAIDLSKKRALKKGHKNFIKATKNVLLGLDNNVQFKSEWLKLPGAILNIFNIDPRKRAKKVPNEEIQEILDLKEKLERGEVVDLSKYRLAKDNPLVLKNLENKLKKDKLYADGILKNCPDKSLPLCKEAFREFAKYASLDQIKKYEKEGYKIDREIFDIIIDRFQNSDHPLNLTNDDIVELIKKLDFDKDDFIALAKKLKPRMNPDALIFLFERLFNEFPKASDAYLFILFELQMIDKVREILENSSIDEYVKFKHLLFLIDNGKNFDIEDFV